MLFICLVFASCQAPAPSITLPYESHNLLFTLPDPPHSSEFISLCAESGIPFEIMDRLIDSESAWNPYAVGYNLDGSKDMGLAQLNSAYLGYYAAEFWDGDLDPFCPEQNVRVASRYMARLYEKTGSWERAVIAYKIGPSRVHEAGPRLKRLARYVVRGG